MAAGTEPPLQGPGKASRAIRIVSLAAAAALLVTACGGSAVPSSLPSADPTAVATPAPAATPEPTPRPRPEPTPSPKPTPAPTPDAAATSALDAFAVLIADQQLAFHMEQTGTMAAAGQVFEFTYTIDIAGRHFGGTLEVAGTALEVRAIKATSYSRQGGGAWTSAPLDEAAVDSIINPWQYLGPLDGLVPGSPSTTPDGAMVFVSAAPVPYATASMRAQGVFGTIESLTFTIRSDGRPVSLAFTASTLTAQGTIGVDSVVTFSKVGGSITIRKPKL